MAISAPCSELAALLYKQVQLKLQTLPSALVGVLPQTSAQRDIARAWHATPLLHPWHRPNTWQRLRLHRHHVSLCLLASVLQ